MTKSNMLLGIQTPSLPQKEEHDKSRSKISKVRTVGPSFTLFFIKTRTKDKY